MIDNQPAEGISTARPQGRVCTETAITNGTGLVPSVSTGGLNSTRVSQPTNPDIDVDLRCRSISLSLTSLSQNNNQQLTTTKTATATGTAAAWFYLIAVVLSPFVEVSR